MEQISDMRMLLFRARLLLEEGQCDRALVVLEAIATDDEKQQQEIAYLLGWCYVVHRRWDDAARVLSPLSRYIEDETDQVNRIDRERLAICLLHLGYAAVNLGQFEEAARHFAKCLKALRDKRVHLPEIEEIKARYSLAMTYTMRGLYPAAIQHYEAALRQFLYIDNDEELGHIYHGLCDTYRRSGDLDNARLAGDKALHLYEDIADRPMEGRMHNLLGHIYQGLGDYIKAADHYTEALSIATTHESPAMVMANCTAIADLRLVEGRLEEAKRYCRRAQEIIDRVDVAYVPGLMYLVSGKVTFAQAQQAEGEVKQKVLEEASRCFEQAKDHLSTTDAFDDLAEAYDRWGKTLEELGHFQEALRCLKSGYEVLSSAKGTVWY